jgi:hypothetical protein
MTGRKILVNKDNKYKATKAQMEKKQINIAGIEITDKVT